MHKALICYWSLVIIIAGLYITLSITTPFLLDDYTFIGNWRDDCHNTDFTLSGWWRFFEFQRSYDNGRIANMLSPVSTLYTPWKEIFPIITGCLMACVAILIQRFANQTISPILLLSTWALMIVGVPWSDTIFVRDYSLNYIWSAAVTLALLWILRKVCIPQTSHRNFLVGLGIVLAVLAGGWHESFAVVTICGLICLTFQRRFKLPYHFYLILTIYILSTLLFMLSPGIIHRAALAVTEPRRPIGLRCYLILIIDTCLLMCSLVTHKGRKNILNYLNSSVAIVCLSIIVAGFILAIVTVNIPRSYFWPDLAAVCLGVTLVNIILKTWRGLNNHPYVTNWAATALGVLCLIQTVSVIIWQIRYTKESNHIMFLLEQSGGGVLNYDYKLPEYPPSYTLNIPISSHIWDNKFHLESVSNYFNRPTKVIPTNQGIWNFQQNECDDYSSSNKFQRL